MNIGSSYEKALLSEASYTDFQGIDILDADAVKTALITKGFSQTQAQDFVDTWKVLAHQPNTASGFSATLFENISTGEKTLAVRGTDELIDWRTNLIDIGFAGTAQNQQQYQELRDFYNGLVADSKLVSGEQVSLAGHSLGGFLAQAFAVEYPARVSHTYTYNAPGFSGDAVEVFRAININLVSGLGSTTGSITNTYAEPGAEFVVRGTLLGQQTGVFIEDQGLINTGNLAGNHSIEVLTDALAVYNLLGTLDPNLTAEETKPILEAAAYRPEESLENILNDFSKLFGISGSVAVDNREAFYARINAIQFYIQESGLTGATKIDSVDNLSGAATEDTTDGYAYRYALLNLNSFAITGNAGLYASGELNAANFTTEYLDDRAQFLALQNRMFTADTSLLQGASVTDMRLDDRESGTTLLTIQAGTVLPDSAPQMIFGSAASESDITGGSGKDRLYGGAGNDIYQYTEGDGQFTIRDSDGSGNIRVTINGVTQTLGNSAIEQVGNGFGAREAA